VGNLEVGSYISFQEKINTTFNISDLTGLEVKITVYKTGTDIEKIEMFVVQGANSDPSSWSLIKSIPWTGDGTTISATAQETADALGITFDEFQPGSSFTFYNRITTVEGKTYDISNINAETESNSNYNMAFRFISYIGCPFTGGMAGDYEVIEDGWADWSAGDVVYVADGPGENQIDLSAVYPNLAYGDPLAPVIVDIDPSTGIASVPEVEYGNYGPLISCTGGGFVFACTGTIDLTLNHFSASTDYGVYRLLLQKL